MIDADAFNEFEAGGWDQTAAGYDRFFAPITGRTIEDLLDAAAVGEGTRVLDLASGPGYVAARAAARGAVPVGVDIAESMVALAGRRHPELEFRRGDAEALPFEDESFDAAVGNFAILHLGRPERAVAELGRVLHPGGGVALTTWDRPERARLLGLVFDAVAAPRRRPRTCRRDRTSSDSRTTASSPRCFATRDSRGSGWRRSRSRTGCRP